MSSATGKLVVALVFALCGESAAARGDDTIGVAVSGDPAIRAPIDSLISTWLADHGHRVEPDAIPAATIGTVGDCFVIQDDGCARTALEQHAASTTVVYVGVESGTSSDGRVITLHAHWIEKDHPTVVESTTCTACTDLQLRDHVDKLMTAVVTASGGMVAPASVERAGSIDGDGERGIALGVELGEPTSATAGWFSGRLAATAGVGSGTLDGIGLAVHGELRYEAAQLSGRFPLRFGAGFRYYRHEEQSRASDTRYGVRAIVEIATRFDPVELYAELAPGVDLDRTRQARSMLFANLAIGARWFL